MNALTTTEQTDEPPAYAPPLQVLLRRRVMGMAGARLDWESVYAAALYGWAGICREYSTRSHGWREPPSRPAFVAAMAYLCRHYGVGVHVRGASVYCVGCTLR